MLKKIIAVALPIIFFSFILKDKPASKPNVILVYMDDMGFGDISRNGALGYQTPNFDRLAQDGIYFSQFYSPQAVCTASRAGLLTGCYPNRLGFSGALDHTAEIGLNTEEETIAELLKTEGYSTAAFGKWHLGHLPDFLPTKHGFDEFYGIPYSHDMWPNHPVTKNYYPELPLIEGEKTIQTNPDQTQFTTSFTEKTIDFIKRKKDKPFFVYLAHPMPHVPLAVSDKFKGKSKQGLYGDVMMELDWSIGQIREILKKLKLEENTLLIVTSDNGPWLNYGNHAGSAGGLREGKGTSFDGGQRVPCMMTWKGKIPAGIVANNLSAALDILPTIVEATGAKMPKRRIDGVSVFNVLKGNTAANPRTSFLYYYRKNNLEAVRDESWKLVFPHPGRTYEGFSAGKDGSPGGSNENFTFQGGLYDLRRDPGERYNVISDNPEVVKRLTQIAEEARQDIGDDLTKSEGKNRRTIGKIKE
ncbi:arylsulfatase [Lacihabitans sp. CCS-44]|uniref:sulfatase family protein n=1 Tax=Lacihabitans sp. CCS-44 TaxID=2487331 RepID=UPI0020CE6798|nr:sulfatase [Lacihabitans sp. CCS-44]MCP9755068.1 arylsulfatase [Lacihabitans sp. CCS-44]